MITAMRRMGPELLFIAVAVAGLGACIGAIGDGSPASGTGAPADPASPAPSAPSAPSATAAAPAAPADRPDAPAAGPAASGPRLATLRRLGRVEYENTVKALLADRTTVALPDDPASPSGFAATAGMADVDFEAFAAAAEDLAGRAVMRLDRLAPCKTDEPSCAAAFVAGFGARAFRRPLTPEESSALLAIYRQARDTLGYDHKGGVRVVLQAILQAPQFLYHWQLGDTPPVREGERVRLAQHELASRLAYAFTASPPDDELLAAAAGGALATPAQAEAQARRLLQTPAAAPVLADFYRQLMRLDGVVHLTKDEKVYPMYAMDTGGARSALASEADDFARYAFGEVGTLEALLTARVGAVNEISARFYGVAGVTGKTVRRVDLPAGRSGALTQLAFLATAAYPYGSSPVRRGKVVRERLLCQPLPPPPADLVINVPTPDPKAQTREQFEVHSKSPACNGCHQLIDPVGYAFEGFDGIGHARDTDAGRPVDTRGVLGGLAGGDRPFDGAAELARVLLGAPETAACMATQWLRYLLARPLDPVDDQALAAGIRRFTDAKLDFRELLVAIAGSVAFRTIPPEGTR